MNLDINRYWKDLQSSAREFAGHSLASTSKAVEAAAGTLTTWKTLLDEKAAALTTKASEAATQAAEVAKAVAHAAQETASDVAETAKASANDIKKAAKAGVEAARAKKS